MKSIIGNGAYEIDREHSVLALVRKGKEDHCFIIIETLDVNHNHVSVKVEFGYYQVREREFDKTRGQVYSNPVVLNERGEPLSRLLTDAAVQSWPISSVQKRDFEQKIAEDQALAAANKLNYVRYSREKLQAPVGSGLQFIGSPQFRDSSAKSNHSLVGQSSILHVSHDSIDSLLRRGLNCTLWALETVSTVIPEFRGSVVARYIAAIPSVEVPTSVIHQGVEGQRSILNARP